MHALITGTWFLCREIELSNIRLEHVELGDLTVSLHLPVSKTDVQARGVRRTHGCSCLEGDNQSKALCPFRTVAHTIVSLRLLFGDEFVLTPSTPFVSRRAQVGSWRKTMW